MYSLDLTDYGGYTTAAMTKKALKGFYKDMVKKSEYSDFNTWFYDMLKMGLVTEV